MQFRGQEFHQLALLFRPRDRRPAVAELGPVIPELRVIAISPLAHVIPS